MIASIEHLTPVTLSNQMVYIVTATDTI